MSKRKRKVKSAKSIEKLNPNRKSRNGVWRSLNIKQRHERMISKRTKYEKQLESELISRGIECEPQYREGSYFIDLRIKPNKLAVEVDGEYHNLLSQIIKDGKRTAYLAEKGWRVIRFTNEKISNDLESVIREIVLARNESTSPLLSKIDEKYHKWTVYPKL